MIDEEIFDEELRGDYMQELRSFFKGKYRNMEAESEYLDDTINVFLDLYDQENWEDLLTYEELVEMVSLKDGDSSTAWLNINSFVDILRQRKKEFIFDFYTKDLIKGVGDEIASFAKSSGKSSFRVLEVGAGDGKLSHYLRQYLKQCCPEVEFEIVAVDTGEDQLSAKFEVVEMGDIEAVNTCQPDFIVQSWMPYGVDLSANWKESSTVQAYLLIGNEEYCGNYETWRENADGFRKRASNVRTMGYMPGSSVSIFQRDFEGVRIASDETRGRIDDVI